MGAEQSYQTPHTGDTVPDFRNLRPSTCVKRLDEKYVVTTDGKDVLPRTSSVLFLYVDPYSGTDMLFTVSATKTYEVDTRRYNDGRWIVRNESECAHILNAWRQASSPSPIEEEKR